MHCNNKFNSEVKDDNIVIINLKCKCNEWIILFEIFNHNQHKYNIYNDY